MHNNESKDTPVKMSNALKHFGLQSNQKRVSGATAKQLHENLKAQQEIESKLVRGKFVFHECPGGVMNFPFRKFKGDKIVTYSMKDGQVYEIPLAVAKHLNTNVSWPVYQERRDEAGNTIGHSVKSHVRRASFQPLDFNI